MILTEERVNAINEMRVMLQEIEHEIWERAQKMKDQSWTDHHDSGRLAETAYQAGDALFRLLNVAGSYCDKLEPVADKWTQLHEWQAARDS